MIDGYTWLPLTFHVKCNGSGVCRVVDDLPIFETQFCTVRKGTDGVVTFDCDFTYLTFKFKGKIRVYIEDGKLCVQKDNDTPKCVPLSEVPADLKEIWRDLNPPYLPTLPVEQPKKEEPITTPSDGGVLQ